MCHGRDAATATGLIHVRPLIDEADAASMVSKPTVGRRTDAERVDKDGPTLSPSDPRERCALL